MMNIPICSGMLVCADEQEDTRFFWAESKDEEKQLFEDFLATLSLYDLPMLFCYGAYERIWFDRMRRTARSEGVCGPAPLSWTVGYLGIWD